MMRDETKRTRKALERVRRAASENCDGRSYVVVRDAVSAELERLTLYKAVAFGEDGLAGDSGVFPVRAQMPDATTDSTFEELLELWARLVALTDHEAILNFDGTVTLSEGGPAMTLGREALVDHICDENWGHERPVGFWLLREEDVEKVMLLELVEAYGDRDGYVLIRAMKTIAARLAKGVVGDASVLDG